MTAILHADTGSLADDDGFRRLSRLAWALVAAVSIGLFGWGGLARIDGAVVGAGELVVDGNIKTVQHLTGGRVAEIRVREGDLVQEGDVLVRLDRTALESSLGVVTARLDEATAREARVEAELAAADELRFPASLGSRAGDPAVAATLAAERSLFEARRAARAGTRAQLDERIDQTRRQIEGLAAQRTAKQQEIALLEHEAETVAGLFDRRLVGLSRTMALQRALVGSRGDLGRIDAATAEARSTIAETEVRILQIDRDLHSEAARDLAEARGQIAELRERRVAAEEDLRNVEVRAPRAGRVHELKLHTIGGVVKAGDTILSIVPLDDRLVAEARVAPADIDRIRLGAEASLRLRAGNQRLLPILTGTVVRVADETSSDARTGASYYTIRIDLPDDVPRLLGDLRLVSGMPIDVQVGTGSRSPLDYLFTPLLEQVRQAWRER